MKVQRISLLALLSLIVLSLMAVTVSAQDEVVPRNETLIVEHAQSSQPNFTNYNWMVPGSILRAAGIPELLDGTAVHAEPQIR